MKNLFLQLDKKEDIFGSKLGVHDCMWHRKNIVITFTFYMARTLIFIEFTFLLC
jgi:hypothetical protein